MSMETQSDRITKILNYCPSLRRGDIKTIPAIRRMARAHKMNGGADKGNVLDNALAYLISLEEPTK